MLMMFNNMVYIYTYICIIIAIIVYTGVYPKPIDQHHYVSDDNTFNAVKQWLLNLTWTLNQLFHGKIFIIMLHVCCFMNDQDNSIMIFFKPYPHTKIYKPDECPESTDQQQRHSICFILIEYFMRNY